MFRREKKKRFLRSGTALFLAIVVLMTSIVPDGGAITVSAAKAKTNIASTTQAKKTKAKVATVATQTALNNALSDKTITKITIKTTKTRTFTVPKKSYQTKTLVISAAKATLVNQGIFSSIVVTNARTIKDFADGNNVVINDAKLTYQANNGAKVEKLTFARNGAKATISADGEIGQILLVNKAALVIKGTSTKKIPIQVQKKAKGSSLTASIPANIETEADANIVLKVGAEGSQITSTNQDLKLTISNQTRKRVVYKTPSEKRYIGIKETVSDDGNASGEEDSASPSPVPTKEPKKDYGNGGNSEDVFSVHFESNGGTSIEPLSVQNGETTGTLPTPQKDNSIFLGWYIDAGFQKQFAESTPILKDITLYARYSEIMTEQKALDDSFALADQAANLSFSIVSSDATMTTNGVLSGVTLTAGGADAVILKATGSTGSFVITAQDGFVAGASYTLTLTDSKLSFEGKDGTVRKCDFSIKKAEVYNIAFDEGIIYIPESNVSNMTQEGEQVNALSVPVVGFDSSSSTDVTTYGSFTYAGNKQLSIGDVLCIYSENKPTAPVNGDDSAYLDDDIAYIKVVSVSGSIGSQTVQYTDADAKEVIFTPDVLPLAAGADTKMVNYVPATSDQEGSFTIAVSDWDFASYTEMGLSDKTTVEKGD
ncbi:MAG: hypothetical protein PWP24_1779, partial [Clostridiales bacterium]|nr:hypothetical protein [Clostridiales bacterium]